MPATWECPQCRRRVPMSITECRCGMFRPRPSAGRSRPRAGEPEMMGPRFSWGGLPGGAKAAVVVGALSLLTGIVWLIVKPPLPATAIPLLGYMDRPAPTPPPVTVPARAQPSPPAEAAQAPAEPHATPVMEPPAEPTAEPTPEPPPRPN